LLLKIILGSGVILSETYSTNNGLIEFRPSLTEDLEAENLRLIMINFRWEYYRCREMFQKHLWEGAAEETSIEVYVSTS